MLPDKLPDKPPVAQNNMNPYSTNANQGEIYLEEIRNLVSSINNAIGGSVPTLQTFSYYIVIPKPNYHILVY